MEFWHCLEESVAEAIGKKVNVDGGINSSILDERLKNMENVLLQRIDQVSGSNGAPPIVRVPCDGAEIDLEARKQLFLIGGKFYCVPLNFAFPAGITCLNGWSLWLWGRLLSIATRLSRQSLFTG